MAHKRQRSERATPGTGPIPKRPAESSRMRISSLCASTTAPAPVTAPPVPAPIADPKKYEYHVIHSHFPEYETSTTDETRGEFATIEEANEFARALLPGEYGCSEDDYSSLDIDELGLIEIVWWADFYTITVTVERHERDSSDSSADEEDESSQDTEALVEEDAGQVLAIGSQVWLLREGTTVVSAHASEAGAAKELGGRLEEMRRKDRREGVKYLATNGGLTGVKTVFDTKGGSAYTQELLHMQMLHVK